MEGHLYQRGKANAWYLLYDLPREKGQKRTQHSVRIGVMSRRDAEVKKREILTRVDRGDWSHAESRITLKQFMEGWLEQRKSNLSAKTHERYNSLAQRHVFSVVGNIEVRKVKPEHINDVYEKMSESGYAKQTILHVHRLLHAAFGYARRNARLVMENVVDRVESPKVVKRELLPISSGDVRLIIDAARGTRLEGPIMLAALSGLRRGEVLALRWRNVNLEDGWLFVSEALEQTKEHGIRFKAPKSRSSRRKVPLSKSLAQMLQSHKTAQQTRREQLGNMYSDNDLVFSNQDGSPWGPDYLSRQFRELADSVEQREYRFHDLRHAFATLTLSNGTPLKEVAELMGHSTPALTLSTYTHSIAGLGREAVQGLERMLISAQEA